MSGLDVQLGPLALKNPLVAVSGTFGFGFDYEPILPPDLFGAVIVKGTSLVPWPGNPPPRLMETPAGMLNAIGLENPGVDVFLRDYLPLLRERGVMVIANVVGRTMSEYVAVSERLSDADGIAALELNISCPNVKAGGMAFGTSVRDSEALVARVRQVTSLPILVKLSPNVSDIGAIARAVEAAGADVISLINTVLGMAIDVHKRAPILGNVFGGLSGPAIRPIALRCIWQVYQSVSLPILGMGGVSDSEDVLAFMMAGASAVGIGTALFADPYAPRKILEALPGDRDRLTEGRWPIGWAHPKGGCR